MVNFFCSSEKILDFLHKSKNPSGFLGETKPSTAAYIDVREERKQVSTTKSPTRLTYAGSLFKSCSMFPSDSVYNNQLSELQ
ncbi:MAG: hypothetical protein LN569_00645 [Rickettsia endosymbiont of Labidopullus appendiculatus]|nr:hypothetical protein [Rickettsia endosymbiont of Labidopullus appendiculatus]